jgi:hypothetical protein
VYAWRVRAWGRRTFDSSLIRSDGGTFDSNIVLLNSVGSINRDLIVGLVTIFHAQVEILDIDVQKGQDQLLLDHLPDDPSLLIAVEFNYRIGDLDLPLACNHKSILRDNDMNEQGRLQATRSVPDMIS